MERARILDVFVLFPSLLHRTHMPSQVRERFKALGIVRPEGQFVNLPSVAGLHQELRTYQNVAFTHLSAKGLVDRAAYVRGILKLAPEQLPDDLKTAATHRNQQEAGLIQLLTADWAEMPLTGPKNIYQNAGLPLRAIAA